MSRSVSSLTCSALETANSASNRMILAACDSDRTDTGGDTEPAAAVPDPSLSTHSFNAPREIPKSAAIAFSVAPGVDSYKSTARYRNSSV